MDLRGFVQGLIAPEPAARPEPRRSRSGLLLVPEQRSSYKFPGAGGTGVPGLPWTADLIPGVNESPPWPYGGWQISSFAIPFEFQVLFVGTEVGFSTEAAAAFTLSLLIDGMVVWSQDVDVALHYQALNPESARFAGTVTANLATPISLGGGSQLGFRAGGAHIDSWVIPPPPHEGDPTNVVPYNATYVVTLRPFRIPYSDDGG
jgi:hypothetical protein